MKPTTLRLSERDIGIVMRCLMDAENRERHKAVEFSLWPTVTDFRKRADRIRAIRKAIKEQRSK